jgi:hypothetical protein
VIRAVAVNSASAPFYGTVIVAVTVVLATHPDCTGFLGKTFVLQNLNASKSSTVI